ncbi:MAG: dihydroxyacetone kinase subunit L [Clostridiales bacterium]|nr:dihydroxyacetone kinase subunit L [Clostridiales bacterium]MDO4349630.1 dihydroxyacetone kinase subunit L [Eubacteriales bacterium]MDY4009268.1 dihydroxyacetone kinase subunit L [Candidatus Limiplasma sp.]
MPYTIDDVQRTLQAAAQALCAMEAELTAIDSKLGDGDMGQSMANGARAIQACLAEQEDESISECLNRCARAFNRAAPSTMGTLLSFALLECAKTLEGKKTLHDQDIAMLPGLFADTIQRYGKAKPGDKTILDALVPFAESVKAGWEKYGDIHKALVQGMEAAHAGMEATKGMEARMGRARWMQGRNAEYPDGGCVMLNGVLRALLQPGEPGEPE